MFKYLMGAALLGYLVGFFAGRNWGITIFVVFIVIGIAGWAAEKSTNRQAAKEEATRQRKLDAITDDEMRRRGLS